MDAPLRSSPFHADIFYSANMESASSQQRSLSDLPIGALSHVSGYLTLPSRALFASALNCRDDSERCSAIVGDQRDVLDFGDIEKELAVKLNDDHVRNALLSIDAVNNLKTLRLTNLLNITGIGLEPLRGSTMIEKIDLSLVGNNVSPDLRPAPPISCTDVLPILDSIIDMGGESSLKLLIFPKKWRKERNIDTEFHAFLGRYNELLCSRTVTCFKCDSNLSDDSDSMMQMENHYEFGTQIFTCCDCMKHYCHDCSEEGEGGIYSLSALCRTCNRRLCFHCSRERACTSCDVWYCVDCMDMKQCVQCDEIVCLSCNRGCRNVCCDEKIWCDSCAENDPNNGLRSCYNCLAEYCGDCCNSNPDEYLNYCIDCCQNLCRECQVIKSKEGMTNYCEGCHWFVLKASLEDKEKQIQENKRQLEEKDRRIQELQAENNKLKRKVKDMNGELEDND